MKNEIRVEIIGNGSRKVLTMEAGGSLKETLLGAGVNVSMPCGGMGRCGKCRVRFINGASEISSGEKSYLSTASDVEKSLLSPEEIESGVRLLCKTRPEADCVVEIMAASEEEMVAETVGSTEEDRLSTAANAEPDRSSETANVVGGDGAGEYGIAIDLGTTTIAAALVDANGKIIDTASCANSQRRYGADVISRISAAEDSAVGKELQQIVWEDIDSLVKELEERIAGVMSIGTGESDKDAVAKIVIAGNTTMLHLLTGKDVSGLGVYPYTPVSLDMETMEHGDLPEITLFPGISAFVGADIVAGLYYLKSELSIPRSDNRKLTNSASAPARVLFIDLGTNGEMALIEGDRITATSTAAGPVFEAGGISCGVASVPGAIAHVEIRDKVASYTTIADKPPIGLCGTGVMELVSELARCGIIDETGLLDEEFFDKGFPVTEDGSIRLTQQDIRNVQMGKAAIASGIRTLTEGRTPDVVYIAGGFGTHIDIGKIKHLKMLPEDFADKIVAIGNASLKGAAKYLSDGASATKVVCEMAKRATVLQLAETPDFDEAYLDSMGF